MHLSIRYPRSHVALHSTHLTFEMFLATSVAEPKLSELVSTLIGEANFASWSTALNANDNVTKSANAVNTSALTSNPTVRSNNLFNN
ncbi:hypothetical protein N7501_009214 [Penicillium viridicatum]|nr:hypothetical protein N7501_009214 [Penicillium viridicatum]